MNVQKRDVTLYRLLRVLVGPIFCKIVNFKTKHYNLDSENAYLVVSNHNMDFDPIYLAWAFKKHMYFVASEHVFRRGFLSKLLVFAFHPISRAKGSTDASAALAIIRKLRAGNNVCLFAEGNRSFNGVTGPVFPATGKLVKSAKAGLVTYHIIGGYHASPRWCTSHRRGPVRGELVNVYSPEQIKSMTPEEINEVIKRDLFEDAFDRQLTEKQPYRGKNLAEKLEYALYLCPKCNRIDTLHSQGDAFRCSCGLDLRYTELGFLESADGTEPPFTTVRDWDIWQSAQMKKLAENLTDAPAFSDENMILETINTEHEMETVTTGTLSLSRDALCCGERSFPVNTITDMAIVGTSRIIFTTDRGEYYQLRSEPLGCGRKYLTLFQFLKN